MIDSGEGRERGFKSDCNAIGSFNGAFLVPDPVSGMLEVDPSANSNGVSPSAVFTIAKKLEFIGYLSQFWPNYTKCADLCGVSRQTVMNHYGIDSVFRAKCDEIKERRVDKLEQFRFEVAETKGGALDRMAVLNAYRREVYNPDKTLTIKHEMTRDEATARAARLRESIDTEATSMYDKVRSNTRSSRLKELRKIKDKA